MGLELCPATTADAGRIAEIHMAAFGANEMLLAQFPTPEVRQALQYSIEQKALADIEDPKITVLIMKMSESREIVAFAKWSHPVHADEDYSETPWIWPEGTDLAVLGAWTARMEEAEGEILGGTPCYRLTFIGTDPQYVRRGAGAMLVNWGIQRSQAEKVPLYLESTREAAAFYSSLGFINKKHVSMELKGADSNEIETYTETIFVFP